MNVTGDLPPQRVLTPRRRRAFLSIRRKSDLLWFIASLAMFSGGIAALGLTAYFIRRMDESVAVPAVATFPLPVPETVPPPPILPEEKTHVPPKAKKAPPPPPAPSKGEAQTTDRRQGLALPKAPLPPSPKKEKFWIVGNTRAFKSDVDRKATMVVRSIESVGEPAVELTYDLSGGEWVQCFVNVREDFSAYSRVQFLFKGEGAPNTLEFKLVDSDGTNVGTHWSRQTGKKTWTVVDLPISDLSYLWGGDSTLDLRRLRSLFFAISKKPGDKGGRGRVIVRGIKFL